MPKQSNYCFTSLSRDQNGLLIVAHNSVWTTVREKLFMETFRANCNKLNTAEHTLCRYNLSRRAPSWTRRRSCI